MMRTGVEPGEASAKLLCAQSARFQVSAIGVCNLEFAARRRFELARNLDDRGVVKIKPRHRPIRPRLFRLFLDMDGQPSVVEFENAVASGVIHPMAEDGRPVAGVRRILHEIAEAGAVKDIIAQYKRAALLIDELFA